MNAKSSQYEISVNKILYWANEAQPLHRGRKSNNLWGHQNPIPYGRLLGRNCYKEIKRPLKSYEGTQNQRHWKGCLPRKIVPRLD